MQNDDTMAKANTALTGTRKNVNTTGSSSFNWNLYYSKDIQKLCFDDAGRVKHRFKNTPSGHMMVIMKVRP